MSRTPRLEGNLLFFSYISPIGFNCSKDSTVNWKCVKEVAREYFICRKRLNSPFIKGRSLQRNVGESTPIPIGGGISKSPTFQAPPLGKGELRKVESYAPRGVGRRGGSLFQPQINN